MKNAKSGFKFSGLWTYQIDTWRNQYFGNFYYKELCGHNRYHYKHDSPIFLEFGRKRKYFVKMVDITRILNRTEQK